MQKNTFKKITTIIYLFIISFGLFFSFNEILAQSKEVPLLISANPIIIKTGEETKITASVYTETGGEIVTFSSGTVLGIFQPNSNCTIPANSGGLFSTARTRKCSVSFKTYAFGTSTIKAETTIGGKKYTADTTLTVDKKIETTPTPQPTTPTVNTDTTYTPLAPLPGLSTDGCKDKDGKACIDTQINKSTNPCPFGNYLNIMIKLIIGIAGVLAMVMIIYGGIEYMTSELVSEKESGKDTISNAILGLLIALGSFLILNTVNPKLLEVCLNNLPEATITIDEANFAKTEQPISSVGLNYKLTGTFENPIPDPSILKLVNEHLSKGETIKTIVVKTGQKRIYFYSSYDWTTYGSTPIGIGYNGVSEAKDVVGGDARTPKGITYTTSDMRPPPKPPVKGKSAVTRDGKFNMGAAFFNLGAKTLDGKDRGIGLHGNSQNTLSPTNACVRIHNDDLIVLAPYMKTGIKVIIE